MADEPKVNTASAAAPPSMPKAEPEAAKPAPAAEPAKPAAGVPTAGASAAKTEDGKNVFTELFGGDKTQKNANMMGAVVEQQDKKTKSLFGKGGSKLKNLKEKGKKSFKVSKSTPGKLVLQVSILILIGVGGFFYTQNVASFEYFGVNVAREVEMAQEDLDQELSEITVQKHLSATLLLDQFSNMADEYLYNLSQAESEYTSANKKADYEDLADEAFPELVDLLERVSGYLDEELSIDARTVTGAIADELIEALKAKEGEVNEQTLLQEIQDLESAKKLMGNNDVKTTLNSMDFENATQEEIETVYNAYSTISASVSSLISSIKNSRILWSVYLDELEDLTKEVDPLFGTEFESNLTVSDVKFSTSGEVLVSGSSLTDDTKNFTLISNLIDTYEASDSFSNVEDRSYSKSADDEESFSGDYRISMDLESLTETE